MTGLARPRSPSGSALPPRLAFPARRLMIEGSFPGRTPLPSNLSDLPGAVAALPLRYKLLLFASVVVVVELLFRRLAPKSAAYRRWTAFFQGLGVVWTSVLLALIYLVSVGGVSLFMKLRARDPLDRSLRSEPSFWRSHEPNPLGPFAAARHQF